MVDHIDIIAQSDRVDKMLEPHREALGEDYVAYRGHVMRVLTYTIYFLRGDQKHRRLIEAALVYHDIGLWTDKELAYLAPSIARALAANAKNSWDFDTFALSAIIDAHHKVFPYRGPYADVVNAVRKADWVDATGGWVKSGLSKRQIASVTAAIPVAGFPDMLMPLVKDLAGGNRFSELLRVLTHVYKW